MHGAFIMVVHWQNVIDFWKVKNNACQFAKLFCLTVHHDQITCGGSFELATGSSTGDSGVGGRGWGCDVRDHCT
jgi:hypothetical protein